MNDTTDAQSTASAASPIGKRYYITTPIYYVNGLPHIGTATTTLLADATARYHKLRGDETYWLTGTDENARKVMEAAQKAGVETQAFVDEVSRRFVEVWEQLNCEYDVFFRTTEPRHARVVQEVFARLLASGDVYKGIYEGWYSVSEETFYRDTDVDAQAQRVLVNGKPTGAVVERLQEETYYFRLSAYADRLKSHIENNPNFLLPESRKNEVLAFIDNGLRDLAITQNRTGWGIPVPGETGKVVYVWFDALINYLTESGWPDNPDWQTLWPADVHLMGKEIFTRFHATLWPATLMALGLPLPKHVVAHGWWLVRDPQTDELVKGSKSGVPLPLPSQVVSLLHEWTGAPEPICVDALRYYILRDIRFIDDSEFSLSMLASRYNADLANDLGNVLNRVLRAGYHTGAIPTPRALDSELIAVAQKTLAGYQEALNRFDWGIALQHVSDLVGAVNLFLQARAPWQAAKNGESDAVADAVYNALEGARLAAYLVSPVMPSASEAIAKQLGVTFAPFGSWEEHARFGALVPGTPTGEPAPLFPRIDKKFVQAPPAPTNKQPKPKKEKQPMSDTTAPATPVTPAVNAAPAEPAGDSHPAGDGRPAGDQITIDDFAKIQFRVADIVSAEKIEGAKKLLKLRVKVGPDEERQIVSGIADAYAPEELPGKQIVVVYNLKPATLRGVESQGMLLAASDEQGRAILLHPDKKTEPGSKVK